MRLFILLGMLISSSAFAADVTLNIDNTAPIVIEADFKLSYPDGKIENIDGPWFVAGYTLTNLGADTVSFSKLIYTATGDLGDESTGELILEQCLEIAPGATADLGRWFIGDLPATEVNYSVKMKALGRASACAQPGEAYETPEINFTAYTDVR